MHSINDINTVYVLPFYLSGSIEISMHNIFLNVENKTNSSAPSVEGYEVSITPKMWKDMES